MSWLCRGRTASSDPRRSRRVPPRPRGRGGRRTDLPGGATNQRCEGRRDLPSDHPVALRGQPIPPLCHSGVGAGGPLRSLVVRRSGGSGSQYRLGAVAGPWCIGQIPGHHPPVPALARQGYRQSPYREPGESPDGRRRAAGGSTGCRQPVHGQRRYLGGTPSRAGLAPGHSPCSTAGVGGRWDAGRCAMGSGYPVG